MRLGWTAISINVQREQEIFTDVPLPQPPLSFIFKFYALIIHMNIIKMPWIQIEQESDYKKYSNKCKYDINIILG